MGKAANHLLLELERSVLSALSAAPITVRSVATNNTSSVFLPDVLGARFCVERSESQRGVEKTEFKFNKKIHIR